MAKTPGAATVMHSHEYKPDAQASQYSVLPVKDTLACASGSYFRSTNRQVPHSPRGFTLLEMVAAMVLAAILFAALVSLLRSFADQQRIMAGISDQRPPTQILSELIRRDLTGARYVRHDGNQLRLVGTIARDRNSKKPTGRQAEVVYRVAQVNGEAWLLRRETHLDEMASTRSHEEPLWQGVVGLDLNTINAGWVDNDQELPPRFAAAAALGLEPAPRQMQLVVRRDTGEQLLSVNVVNHWEDG